MENKHVHFIGVGGISMSGIAKILLTRGSKVTGSDLKDNHLLNNLRNLGAKIYIGHSEGNLNKPDAVVISNAIPEDNVELVKARELKVPIYKRAEMIAKLMKDNYGIAISGTHGKTTTTAMVSLVFKEGQLDPTIMVGGELENIGGNVHIGKGDYLITEADESDGSLLYFDPLLSIVTNIELDHINYYDSEEKLIDTFTKFINKPPSSGKAVACAEDKIIKKIISNNNIENVLTYGITKGDLRAKKIELLPFGSYFEVVYNDHSLGKINLQVPGKYNILNALAAIAAGMYAGLSFTKIKNALEKFNGVHRRFEKKGLIGEILGVDDYEHQPTQIKETLAAAKNTGYNRVIVAFQPHRYSRTKHLFEEFSKSFNNIDHLIITDIYSADEKPESVEDQRRAKKLANTIARKQDFNVDYIAKCEDITTYLEEIIQPRDLILTIGAGDIYKVGEKLIDKMRREREMA